MPAFVGHTTGQLIIGKASVTCRFESAPNQNLTPHPCSPSQHSLTSISVGRDLAQNLNPVSETEINALRSKYSCGEVDRIVSAGNLSRLEVYRLRHQHPLNRITHVVGIPRSRGKHCPPHIRMVRLGNVAWKELLVLSALVGVSSF
jgi:hypothetical protein